MSFAQGSALKCHKRIHSNERPFVCKMCSKSFSQNTTLKTHVSAFHTGKNISCEIPGCAKKFTRKSYLKIHMRDHDGERNYSCDRCEKKYKQKSHLDRHIEASHLGIKHKCDFPGCNSEYSKSWTLKMHKFVHTTENNFPYKCHICERGFQRRDKLLKHLAKSHTETSAHSAESDCISQGPAVADSNHSSQSFEVFAPPPEVYTIHNLDGSMTQIQTI